MKASEIVLLYLLCFDRDCQNTRIKIKKKKKENVCAIIIRCIIEY